MKKLALFFSVFLLVFTSCSSSDEAPVIEEEQLTINGTLLRKVISTSGSDVTTSELFYNGNKLSKIVKSDGSRVEYEYTGNLITKAYNYVNNSLNTTTFYYYNSADNITQRKTLNANDTGAYRCDFVYNADGTVSVLAYTGDATSQNTLVVNRKVFLLTNGDVDKIEVYLIISGSAVTRTYTYTYDTNNYSYNQVVGNNKLKAWDFANSGNQHNILSTVITSTEVSSAYPSTTNSSYTYNSFNFPVTMTFNGVTFQYFYQQP